MSRHPIYDEIARITGDEHAFIPESRLLLRLYATIVQLHASLADAAAVDRKAHLIVLRDLKEMADDIEQSEPFRMAERSPLAEMEMREVVARNGAKAVPG